MYETIIVPLDDSETSRHALPTAVMLGRAWGVPVQLVTVESPGIGTTDAKYWLDRAMEGLDVPTRPPVVLESNDVGGALTGFVAEHTPALLCMSTHGRGALGSVVVGSTAADVLAVAVGPVLLVGPHAVPHLELRSIIVGVEPMVATVERLGPVIDLAKGSGAGLHLVSVLTDAEAVLVGEVEARERLAELAASCRDAGVETSWVLRESNDVADALIESARTTSAGIIAATTRATRGLTRLFLGSTAAQVVRRAPCPVLVTPPER